MHNAVLSPMPGAKIGNALAESWTESLDGLMYEFKLRPGLRFHNGDPCTAEDVQGNFERYTGRGAAEYRANVQRVEAVDPLTVRFHPQSALAGFYNVLRHHSHCSSARRAKEISGKSRRGWFQKAPHWPGTL